MVEADMVVEIVTVLADISEVVPVVLDIMEVAAAVLDITEAAAAVLDIMEVAVAVLDITAAVLDFTEAADRLVCTAVVVEAESVAADTAAVRLQRRPVLKHRREVSVLEADTEVAVPRMMDLVTFLRAAVMADMVAQVAARVDIMGEA